MGLNKTKTRNSLVLDGTLSSIMTIKMSSLEPCFRWDPLTEVIKASRRPQARTTLPTDLRMINQLLICIPHFLC